MLAMNVQSVNIEFRLVPDGTAVHIGLVSTERTRGHGVINKRASPEQDCPAASSYGLVTFKGAARYREIDEIVGRRDPAAGHLSDVVFNEATVQSRVGTVGEYGSTVAAAGVGPKGAASYFRGGSKFREVEASAGP